MWSHWLDHHEVTIVTLSPVVLRSKPRFVGLEVS
jgi:hypothetical protein